MKYKKLGMAGVKVSELCLGTMNFGSFTSETDSFSIMDQAFELGINFIDTANVYGKLNWEGKAKGIPIGDGQTESIIGKWISKNKGKRDKIVLATKVCAIMDKGPNERGLSAYHIRRACEDSLRRLQVDYIDLYQMHHIDPDVPWEEIWQAMEQLTREGKIIYAGSSNFAGWNIAQAQSIAASRGFMGIASEQSIYNLSNRTVELEVIPACREYGVGLIPWSPLGGGLLSGVLDKIDKGRTMQKVMEIQIEKNLQRLEMYESFCREKGEKPQHIALAWLLHNPIVVAPIIGPRLVEQLTESIHSLDIELSEDDLIKLDEIWPGPGGEAPWAYAW